MKLHNLYSSPNVMRFIKSRKMRWAENETRMEEECLKCFGGKPRKMEAARKT
jgi:hypothetical protein